MQSQIVSPAYIVGLTVLKINKLAGNKDCPELNFIKHGYQNTLKYLYESVPMFQQIGSEAYKPGLETTHKLDEHFGHPHQQFKTIHIAGTNGKGSCSHTIAAVLQCAGYRVGLFTSPHLIDFRERIRINGEMIPEEYVVNFVEEHRAFFEPLHPSFFELTTAMAFRYFADQKVDVAVIEVGMGGRLDCTNIIHPDLCVITNIGLDHTQYLGDTLTKIAKEKAGIIKEGVPVVIGRAKGAVRRVFTMKAKEKNAPIVYAQEFDPLYKMAMVSYPELQKERIKVDAAIQEMYETIELLDNQSEEERANAFRETMLILTPEDSMRAMDQILDKRKDCIRIATRDFPIGLYTELSGLCQFENTLTILTALTILTRQKNYRIRHQDYYTGFANVCKLTGLMGRWQKVTAIPTLSVTPDTMSTESNISVSSLTISTGNPGKRFISYSVWSTIRISAVSCKYCRKMPLTTSPKQA